MNEPRETSGPKPNKKRRYLRWESPEGWLAVKAGWPVIGTLRYETRNDRYLATCRLRMRNFRPAGKGQWEKGESPIYPGGKPKSEFLMILTLRADSPEHQISALEISLFRRATVTAALAEREANSGHLVSQAVRKNAYRVASSISRFENWVSSQMVGSLEGPMAAARFSKYAKWIPVIDRVLSSPSDPEEVSFLKAVEEAAAICRGVPTSQAVADAFYRDRSINQRGSGSTFRTLKTRLDFDWLPSARPGPKRTAR